MLSVNALYLQKVTYVINKSKFQCIGLFVFLLLSFKSCLCILDRGILPGINLANIFSQFVTCLFILLTVFCLKKLFLGSSLHMQFCYTGKLHVSGVWCTDCFITPVISILPDRYFFNHHPPSILHPQVDPSSVVTLVSICTWCLAPIYK